MGLWGYLQKQLVSKSQHVLLHTFLYYDQYLLTYLNRQPLIAKPSGASLLYVSSFCKEIFGDLAPLETCRAELRLHCQVDVLTWFETSPAENRESSQAVQKCLTNKYQQQSDFVTQFNRKIETQEKHAKVSPPAPKKGPKFFVFGALILVFILMLCGSVKIYLRIKKNLKDKELEDKLLGENIL